MVIKARNLTPTMATGFVSIPLQSWRVTDAANTNVGLVAATAAIGSGGVMGIDSEPKLTRKNAATDKALQLIWTAGAADPLFNTWSYPVDLDKTQPAFFKMLTASGGTTDEAAFTVGWWQQPLALGAYVLSVDIGGLAAIVTEQGVASTVGTKTSTAIYSRTITAANLTLTTGKYGLANLEITPVTHATDTAIIYATWIEYSRK